jgi:hypothetical protein
MTDDEHTRSLDLGNTMCHLLFYCRLRTYVKLSDLIDSDYKDEFHPNNPQALKSFRVLCELAYKDCIIKTHSLNLNDHVELETDWLFKASAIYLEEDDNVRQTNRILIDRLMTSSQSNSSKLTVLAHMSLSALGERSSVATRSVLSSL